MISSYFATILVMQVTAAYEPFLFTSDLRFDFWFNFSVWPTVKMSQMMQQLQLLKDFVALCQKDPDVLHEKELKFFKDWLER